MVVQTPVNRIVLLGASNLTMSLRAVIQLLQQHCGGPSEVLAAAGHGRSYGRCSRVFVRELPGIVQSGLWRQLQSGRPLPVYAFLTDVGNDILYGHSSEQIVRWVSWCIEQLQEKKATIILMNLPLTSIQTLSEFRFNLLRSILFPSCRLSRIEVLERAQTVYRGLEELAKNHQLKLYEPQPDWMGFDKIHLKFWKRRAFFQHIFSDCVNSSVIGMTSMQGMPGRDKRQANSPIASWRQRPQFAENRFFGMKRIVAQPSGLFTDRTVVSLY